MLRRRLIGQRMRTVFAYGFVRARLRGVIKVTLRSNVLTVVRGRRVTRAVDCLSQFAETDKAQHDPS